MRRVSGLQERSRRGAAIAALVGIAALTVTVVLFAAAGSDVFSMHPSHLFPGWEAGPLAGVLGRPLPRHSVALRMLTYVTLGSVALYLVAVWGARSLRMREVWLFVAFTGVVLLLGPPARLNDVFNYLGYARLGGLHGLDPYTHVIGAERSDPVFAFTSWRNLASPYGPLFTALTYPLARLPLALSYWLFKGAIVLASFGFLYCVKRCAELLGRDPRRAVLFVAANPLYLYYEVGGFHNDFIMLLPSTAAVALILARRERWAGVAITAAIAVKFTTVVMLPFLLVAAWRGGSWRRLAQGVAIATVPLALGDVALFGSSIPNVADQSGLVTGYSIPNLTGLALGLGGGTPLLIRCFEVLVVVVIALGLRRRDWVAGAGWAQLAMVAGLAWLMPWYLVWALPLAALTPNLALRRTTLAFTVFLLITFLPVTGPFLAGQGLNPAATALGRAAARFEQRLQWQHHGGRRRHRSHAGRGDRTRDHRVLVAAPRRPEPERIALREAATISRRCSDCLRSAGPTA